LFADGARLSEVTYQLLTLFCAFDSLSVPVSPGGCESDFETLKMSSGDAAKSIGRATDCYKNNN
jgi:hypothetical protein